MAVPTDVDRSAPVLAHHEIEIQASLDTVWQLHIDVNGWPTWQEAITEAHISGPFEPGKSFDWSIESVAVTSHIYEVTDRSRTLWGGKAQGITGITGIHEWLFAETDGGVRVITNESFAGDFARADVAEMQGQLDALLLAWLDYLRSAAEGSG